MNSHNVDNIISVFKDHINLQARVPELTKQELQSLNLFVTNKREAHNSMLKKIRSLRVHYSGSNVQPQYKSDALFHLLCVLYTFIQGKKQRTSALSKLVHHVRKLHNHFTNFKSDSVHVKQHWDVENAGASICNAKYNLYEHCLMHLNGLAYQGNKKYKIKLRIKQRELRKGGIDIDSVFIRRNNMYMSDDHSSHMRKLNRLHTSYKRWSYSLSKKRRFAEFVNLKTMDSNMRMFQIICNRECRSSFNMRVVKFFKSANKRKHINLRKLTKLVMARALHVRHEKIAAMQFAKHKISNSRRYRIVYRALLRKLRMHFRIRNKFTRRTNKVYSSRDKALWFISAVMNCRAGLLTRRRTMYNYYLLCNIRRSRSHLHNSWLAVFFSNATYRKHLDSICAMLRNSVVTTNVLKKTMYRQMTVSNQMRNIWLRIWLCEWLKDNKRVWRTEKGRDYSGIHKRMLRKNLRYYSHTRRKAQQKWYHV